MPELQPSNGGYKSRKFNLTVLGLILVTAVALSALKWPAIVAVFPTFVGGILGILSLYFTGNVINRYVVNKRIIEEKKVNNNSSNEEE